MHLGKISSVGLPLLLSPNHAWALVAQVAIRAPSFTVSEYVGKATGFPHVGRDGGGGGTVNGKNVIVFSDTTTSNKAGSLVNFTSNSYAYVLNPRKNPLELQDFGSVKSPKVPRAAVPWHGAETLKGHFIWPNSISPCVLSKLKCLMFSLIVCCTRPACHQIQ